MIFAEENLDLVLVPSGLLIMLAYHLILLYRCLHHPHTTVIGFENNDKRVWVERIMQVDKKDLAIPLTVIANNMSGSTFLSLVSLTLSAIMGCWIGNISPGNVFASKVIYGDTRLTTISFKYLSLLACLLVSFFCFIQSTRCLIHANFLITIPHSHSDTSVKNHVEKCIITGGHFWALGLRAFYVAINLLFWFFGPIPMFATSLVMVFLLSYLDTNTTPLYQHRLPPEKDSDHLLPSAKERSFTANSLHNRMLYE